MPHHLLDVDAGGATEDHEVQQRVAAQAVCAVDGNAGHLADRIEAIDSRVLAARVLRERLPVDVGGDAAHHVVAGGHHGDGFSDRVHMGEGAREFENPRQTGVEHVRTEVVELEQYVILVGPHASAFEQFQDHGASHHVAAGQVLRRGGVALHEAFAVGVDEIAALAPASFRHEHARAVDAGGVELPHLDVLHRHADAQRHAHAVARVHQRVGGAGVDAAGAAGGEDRRPGLDEHHLAGLDLDGHHAHHGAVGVGDEVHREPFGEEGRAVSQIVLIQRVQQGVAGAVLGGAGARCLAALAEILGLAAERALVDAPRFRAGERQPHVFELEHRLGADAAHVFDGVLIADVVGPLDGVVHMPAPVVVRVVAADGTGDAALGGDSVGAGWEDLRQHGGSQARLRQLQAGPHPGATAADDEAVELHPSQSTHLSPQMIVSDQAMYTTIAATQPN